MLVPRFERITLPFVQKLFYLILFHLSYPELKIFHRGVMEISSFVRVDILKRLKISRVKFIAGRGKLIKIAMGVRLFLFSGAQICAICRFINLYSGRGNSGGQRDTGQQQ